MRSTVLAIAALIAVPLAGISQPAGWNDPYPPHRVMDNLYYVGTTMLATFLVATPDGHILINSDYETTVPVIRDNMAELGFNFEDIRIVLGSHAHADHVEADALIQELTGAEVMAARGDVPALREIRPDGKEHPIDRILDDGDEVTLGGTTLTAHVMPGHTKGCTSWGMELTEDGQTYQALIVCSLNGGFLELFNNPDYPEIADDFVATFEKARALPVDVFLSSHGVFYGLDAKYEQLLDRAPGDPNPFVDPEGYQAHIDEYEEIFQTRLEEQRNAAETTDP